MKMRKSFRKYFTKAKEAGKRFRISFKKSSSKISSLRLSSKRYDAISPIVVQKNVVQSQKE